MITTFYYLKASLTTNSKKEAVSIKKSEAVILETSNEVSLVTFANIAKRLSKKQQKGSLTDTKEPDSCSASTPLPAHPLAFMNKVLVLLISTAKREQMSKRTFLHQ